MSEFVYKLLWRLTFYATLGYAVYNLNALEGDCNAQAQAKPVHVPSGVHEARGAYP